MRAIVISDGNLISATCFPYGTWRTLLLPPSAESQRSEYTQRSVGVVEELLKYLAVTDPLVAGSDLLFTAT